MGEGEGGMIWENSIETCILSSVKQTPVQVGCMRQVLGAGALGWPRGMGWGGRWEGSSGWGMHLHLWLIHVNVWQKPLQYCKVISLQLIKIIGRKTNKKYLVLDSIVFFYLLYKIYVYTHMTSLLFSYVCLYHLSPAIFWWTFRRSMNQENEEINWSQKCNIYL